MNIEADYRGAEVISSHYFDGTVSISKQLNMINNFIELNYLQAGINGLELTNAGIQYLKKQMHQHKSDHSGTGLFYNINIDATGKRLVLINNYYKSTASDKFKDNVLIHCDEHDYDPPVTIPKKVDDIEIAPREHDHSEPMG